MFRLWKIAYRDLGRNRRRSLLTMVAVASGLALLIVMSGLKTGALEGSLESSIRLQTGHVQVRAASYDEGKLSLAWEDLLDDAEGLAAQARALPQVKAATPVLWASGVLGTRDESVGVRVVGVDPLSEVHAPFRNAIVAGSPLVPDDRSGVLVGQRLADGLGLTAGQRVSLLVSTADEQPDEAVFVVRGVYATGNSYYDDGLAFMPLAKAQAFTHTEGRASAVFILANNREEAGAIAAALRGPGRNVLTWRDLNELILQSVAMSGAFMSLMNLVTLAVVAVVIANTLLMAVFERTREIGILAALGMKGRQVLSMFLLEAGLLGLAGVALGVLLGGLGVAYFATAGLPVGDVSSISVATAYGSTLYARFSLPDTVSLSVAGLLITLLASLYPAWLAARLEPVEALRS